MVNIDEFSKQSGMFLKADDVINSPQKEFVINGEASIVENEKFGGLRLHVPGNFNGESKTFDCSKTNGRAISEGMGTTETSEWLGTILILETYKTKLSDGRMVNAINIKEVRKAGASATVPAPTETAAPAEAAKPAESTEPVVEEKTETTETA